jgi:uncharacterized protein (TIGR02996 family)
VEDRIADAPDDADVRRVVADWLTERGDPRGELITAHLAREAGDARVQPVIDRLEAALGSPDAEVEWERGYWRRLRYASEDGKLDEYRALLAHPSARFLRELVIGDLGPDVMYDDPFLEGLPRTLRSIDLERDQICAELALPALEEIRIEGSVHKIVALPTEKLRRLSLGNTFFAPVEHLARLTFPALEELELCVVDTAWARQGGDRIFARVPALRRLTLSQAGYHMCVSIAGAGLLGQLEVLRLEDSSLPREAVDLLLERGLDRLKTVELSRCFISSESFRKLADRPFQLRVEE